MILIAISITIIAAGVFLLLNWMSTRKNKELIQLAKQRVKVETKYTFMVERRKEKKSELEKKQKRLKTLENNNQGIKVVSATELDLQETDESVKVGNFLIQEGKITLEQNLKVLDKMKVMNMDYLGACLALGFIDMETAQRAIKINRISSKTTVLS